MVPPNVRWLPALIIGPTRDSITEQRTGTRDTAVFKDAGSPGGIQSVKLKSEILL